MSTASLWSALGAFLVVFGLYVGITQSQLADLRTALERHRELPIHPGAGERLSSLEQRVMQAEAALHNFKAEFKDLHELLMEHHAVTIDVDRRLQQRDGRPRSPGP